MCKEPTGTEYGYRTGWQHNATREFDKEPAAVIDFSYRELIVRVNTFQWLKSRVSYDEGLDRIFQHWASKSDNKHKNWLDCSREFVRWLDKKCPKARVSGIYGEGPPVIIYTYNEQNVLDQDIQFVYFETRVGREAYVLLQTHNGADARIGMSQSRAFRCDSSRELGIFDYGRVNIVCDYEERTALLNGRGPLLPGITCEEPDYHVWISDDGGYRLYEETWPMPHNAKINLRDVRVVFEPDHANYDEDKDAFDPEETVIVVNAAGEGKCPHCGCTLRAYAM